MLTNAAVRRDDTAVPEEKISGQRPVVHDRCDVHRAGAIVRRGDTPSILRHIMTDALRQRSRQCRRGKRAEATSKRNALHPTFQVLHDESDAPLTFLSNKMWPLPVRGAPSNQGRTCVK